ncbi:hypothetical protein HNQ91_000583 [Filimonas zeae]|nr:PQQ-binding-like beta-propeller repeat protein [Filimonas zeae]MDR6337561.1 hypothetical protein [Filimonas zeae]
MKIIIPILLLLSLRGTAQSVTWNGERTVVILPSVTRTLRPGEATVNEDVRTFCGDDNFFFISSSVRGRRVSYDYAAFMQFSLSAIPEGAIVDKIDLTVYLNKVKNTSSVIEQAVSLYELGGVPVNQAVTIGDSSSIAMSRVSKKDIGQDIHLQPDVANDASWVKNRKGTYYCLLAAQQTETYGYYTERSDNKSKQPKLVITYHMPANQVRLNSWPQYKYNAQHTGVSVWQSNAAATAFALHKAYAAGNGGYINSDPLLNDDKLVFAFQAPASPMYRLQMINQQGKVVGETTTEQPGKVSYGPVADRKGNVYCLTGNEGSTLTVTDKDKLQVIFSKQLEANAQTRARPVIGFDGSIYLSTDKGIYAYTPQPECKLKWVYATSVNKFGTVALNEAENVVYVYDGLAGKVVALNSVDGVKKWETVLQNTFDTHIPVPSVKNGRLCVTNGLTKGNRFFIIDAGNGNILQTVQAAGEVISQPVIGTDKVFIINNGQLEAYALQNGARLYTSAVTGLNAASALVADAGDNVYALNTEQGKQSLTMINAGGAAAFALPFADANGNLTGNRLLMVPDGCLVAGNDNYVYTFRPSALSVNEDITIPFNNGAGFISEYLYRTAGKVSVAGKTLTGNQNVVIHAGKNIVLQPDFTVQLGASLSCKTGL